MNLEVVYPNPNNPNEEMSFEELRAKSRGWTSRNWGSEKSLPTVDETASHGAEKNGNEQTTDLLVDYMLVTDVKEHSTITVATEVRVDTISEERTRVSRSGRTKKIKVMEVKAETQTGMCCKILRLLRYVITLV